MNETPDQATRRRWVTLAEVVAVAGVVIAALTLYLGWSDRRADEAERRAERAQARAASDQSRQRIGLIATDVDGDVLAFKGIACALQSADISFPTSLGVAPQNTVLDHRIDADWFDQPLLKLTGAARAERGILPVRIASRCVGEGGDRVEDAIYDLPYRVDARFLRGDAIRLRGLVLRERGGSQARLDALWRTLAPRPRG